MGTALGHGGKRQLQEQKPTATSKPAPALGSQHAGERIPGGARGPLYGRGRMRSKGRRRTTATYFNGICVARPVTFRKLKGHVIAQATKNRFSFYCEAYEKQRDGAAASTRVSLATPRSCCSGDGVLPTWAPESGTRVPTRGRLSRRRLSLAWSQ